MIEYSDDKFGIIKVLNVTEARAHFATVLGDNHSHYVITKNNKPMRVIIGYGDYEKLKQQLGPEFVSSIQEVGQSYSGQHTEAALAEVAHKQKKAKSRVPGILESNIALSYSVPDKREKMAPAKEVERQAPLPQTQNADDYFSSASIESFDEGDLLSHPDDMHKSVAENVMPESAPVADPMSSEQAQAIHEALQQAIDANAKAKKYSATSSEKQLATKSPVAEMSEAPVVEKKKDPEQDDYFRKYKKLYERFETPKMPQEPEESEAVEEKAGAQGQAVFDDRGLENELEAFPESEAKAPDPVEEPNEYFGQPEQEAPPAQKIRTKQQPGVFEARPSQHEAGQGHEPKPASRQGVSSELPSLKDLLASLDEEKLSGEDEEVDESEIENLIQRIQED